MGNYLGRIMACVEHGIYKDVTPNVKIRGCLTSVYAELSTRIKGRKIVPSKYNTYHYEPDEDDYTIRLVVNRLGPFDAIGVFVLEDSMECTKIKQTVFIGHRGDLMQSTVKIDGEPMTSSRILVRIKRPNVTPITVWLEAVPGTGILDITGVDTFTDEWNKELL